MPGRRRKSDSCGKIHVSEKCRDGKLIKQFLFFKFKQDMSRLLSVRSLRRGECGGKRVKVQRKLILFINWRWRQSKPEDVLFVCASHRHPVQHFFKTFFKNLRKLPFMPLQQDCWCFLPINSPTADVNDHRRRCGEGT